MNEGSRTSQLRSFLNCIANGRRRREVEPRTSLFNGYMDTIYGRAILTWSIGLSENETAGGRYTSTLRERTFSVTHSHRCFVGMTQRVRFRTLVRLTECQVTARLFELPQGSPRSPSRLEICPCSSSRARRRFNTGMIIPIHKRPCCAHARIRSGRFPRPEAIRHLGGC